MKSFSLAALSGVGKATSLLGLTGQWGLGNATHWVWGCCQLSPSLPLAFLRGLKNEKEAANRM